MVIVMVLESFLFLNTNDVFSTTIFKIFRKSVYNVRLQPSMKV